MPIENYAVLVRDFRANDTFAAIEAIHCTGTPVEVAESYHSLVDPLLIMPKLSDPKENCWRMMSPRLHGPGGMSLVLIRHRLS